MKPRQRSKPKYLKAPGAGHYGNESHAIRTQAETARILGITAQRVGQIERIAFAKIRKALEP